MCTNPLSPLCVWITLGKGTAKVQKKCGMYLFWGAKLRFRWLVMGETLYLWFTLNGQHPASNESMAR